MKICKINIDNLNKIVYNKLGGLNIYANTGSIEDIMR